VIVLPLSWWTCTSVAIGRGACSAVDANQEGKYGAADIGSTGEDTGTCELQVFITSIQPLQNTEDKGKRIQKFGDLHDARLE
jgi:hypothetical protein